MSAITCDLENGMERENSTIARGLRHRDPDLLDRLIEQYQHRLLRFLIYLTGNRETAEDLFQETWLRVVTRGDQYDDRYEFSTWLFAVARHLALDHLRRKKCSSLDELQEEEQRLPVGAVTASSAFDLLSEREQGERLESALGHVPAQYREVILLRFQEDMTLEEIATVTGAPLGTVKSRLYRGLETLRGWLKGVL